MTDQPPSGNRWEPDPADAPGEYDDHAPDVPVRPRPAGEPGPAARPGLLGSRLRAGIVAGAALLFLGTGAAGYALGTASGHRAPDGAGFTPSSVSKERPAPGQLPQLQPGQQPPGLPNGEDDFGAAEGDS